MAAKPKSESASKPSNSPPTFADSDGRVWTIKLSLGLIDRVQSATQIDLAPEDNNVSPITQLIFQSRLLGQVLWECCRPAAESAGVSREEFVDRLDPESLAAGWGALQEAVIFFIHSKSPAVAVATRRAMEAEMQVVEAGARQMIATLESTTTEKALKEAIGRIGREMQEGITTGLGKSPIRSRE